MSSFRLAGRIGKPTCPTPAGPLADAETPHGETNLIKLLLLPVFVITLAVPFFNKTGPSLFGFPFFYWYQILAVPVSSLLIFIVFQVEDRGDEQ